MDKLIFQFSSNFPNIYDYYKYNQVLLSNKKNVIHIYVNTNLLYLKRDIYMELKYIIVDNFLD